MTDNFGRSLDYRIDLAVLVLRKQFKLTQKELARRMKLPRTYISKIERRSVDPTIWNVNKLARSFRMSPRRFMGLATIKP